MDLNYTEEERAFQSEVRQFLADYLPKNIAAAVRAHDGLTKEMMDEWHAILNKKAGLPPSGPKTSAVRVGAPFRNIFLRKNVVARMRPVSFPLVSTCLAPCCRSLEQRNNKTPFCPASYREKIGGVRDILNPVQDLTLPRSKPAQCGRAMIMS